MMQISPKQVEQIMFKVQKQPSKPLLVIAVTFMWGILMFPHTVVGYEAKSVSDPGSSLASADFFSGVVTGVSEKKVAINNKGYGLHKHVIVQDDEGALLDLSEIVQGLEVQFHLNKGKIDQLVLILPR